MAWHVPEALQSHATRSLHPPTGLSSPLPPLPHELLKSPYTMHLARSSRLSSTSTLTLTPKRHPPSQRRQPTLIMTLLKVQHDPRRLQRDLYSLRLSGDVYDARLDRKGGRERLEDW